MIGTNLALGQKRGSISGMIPATEVSRQFGLPPTVGGRKGDE